MVNAPSLWLPKSDRHLPYSGKLSNYNDISRDLEKVQREIDTACGQNSRAFPDAVARNSHEICHKRDLERTAAGQKREACRTMSESKNQWRVPINCLFDLQGDEQRDVREFRDSSISISRRCAGRAFPQFRLRNDSQRPICISARAERPQGRDRCSTLSPRP
jgi:hypothetical protein